MYLYNTVRQKFKLFPLRKKLFGNTETLSDKEQLNQGFKSGSEIKL